MFEREKEREEKRANWKWQFLLNAKSKLCTLRSANTDNARFQNTLWWFVRIRFINALFMQCKREWIPPMAKLWCKSLSFSLCYCRSCGVRSLFVPQPTDMNTYFFNSLRKRCTFQIIKYQINGCLISPHMNHINSEYESFFCLFKFEHCHFN